MNGILLVALGSLGRREVVAAMEGCSVLDGSVWHLRKLGSDYAGGDLRHGSPIPNYGSRTKRSALAGNHCDGRLYERRRSDRCRFDSGPLGAAAKSRIVIVDMRRLHRRDKSIPHSPFTNSGTTSKSSPPSAHFSISDVLAAARAELVRYGHDAHATQIEAVASQQTWIVGSASVSAIRMVGTGFVEKLEIGIGQMEQVAKLGGKFSPAFAVAVIIAFIDASGIVENGEQLDDFDLGIRGRCQTQTVFQNPRPMPDAVRAIPTECVVFENAVDEGFEVHRSFSSATASSTATAAFAIK